MDKDDLLVLIDHVVKEQIKNLDLSNRDISELPDEIGNLSHLKSLNLGYNNIRQLPDSISKITGLESLILNNNELESIPDTIGELNKLRHLDVAKNNLTCIPKNIGFLSNLQTLDASYCKIETLPLSLTNLLSLRELELAGNNFSFPPEKIIKRGLYATMYFLGQEKRKNEQSEVLLQIANMPPKLQLIFRQYTAIFNNLLTNLDININIKTNFANQDSFENNIDSSQYGILLRQMGQLESCISTIENNMEEYDKSQLISDIKVQMKSLNALFNEKISSFHTIREQITTLSKKIEEIK